MNENNGLPVPSKYSIFPDRILSFNNLNKCKKVYHGTITGLERISEKFGSYEITALIY